MSTSVFKIRRKSDGLFSSGGAYPKWSKHGKSWATLGRAVDWFRYVELGGPKS